MRLYLTLLLATTCLSDPLAGPFKVIVDRIDMCQTEFKLSAVHHIIARRDRRNPSKVLFFGNLTFSENQFEDSHTSEARFASWSARGGWKENAIVIKGKGSCTTAKTMYPALFRSIMASLEGPSKTCPFVPGEYYLHNYTFELTSDTIKSVPAFFYGKWKVRAFSYVAADPRKLISCAEFYGNIIPK